jgi:hypothetical protein
MGRTVIISGCAPLKTCPFEMPGEGPLSATPVSLRQNVSSERETMVLSGLRRSGVARPADVADHAGRLVAY